MGILLIVLTLLFTMFVTFGILIPYLKRKDNEDYFAKNYLDGYDDN